MFFIFSLKTSHFYVMSNSCNCFSATTIKYIRTNHSLTFLIGNRDREIVLPPLRLEAPR